MPEEKPAPKPAREPQALSSEYHKARKQVMLWAGILFIWELVGIDLEKAKEVGGNAGALITAIKSPQAIPWVLLVLVGYFLFKLWIEWNQCGPLRRATHHSRIDFRSAWVVALVAYLLYAYQAIGRNQIADQLLSSVRTRSVLAGTIVGFGIAFMSIFVIMDYTGKRLRNPRRIATNVAQSVLGIFFLITGFQRGILSPGFLLLGVLIGVIIFVLGGFVLHLRKPLG